MSEQVRNTATEQIQDKGKGKAPAEDVSMDEDSSSEDEEQVSRKCICEAIRHRPLCNRT